MLRNHLENDLVGSTLKLLKQMVGKMEIDNFFLPFFFRPPCHLSLAIPKELNLKFAISLGALIF